jgi:hypothetical protein
MEKVIHPVDAHQAAGKYANDMFRQMYGKDHFECNTPEHDFWLKCFDHGWRVC